MGPVVIGFFVFVIVGEGACIRLSRHGVPDSMPYMCSLFWEFGGARGGCCCREFVRECPAFTILHVVDACARVPRPLVQFDLKTMTTPALLQLLRLL